MLERGVLLVRPPPASAVRAIVDADSGAPLGFARREAPRSWCRPFARAILAVHEHEDAPLLFTVRRAWGLLPRREVRDADGHPVGSLLGRAVHDRHGRRLAALYGEVFRGRDQRPLAELTAGEEGTRVAFSPDIAGEPFLKMLLLAAALEMTE
jgi:hypothetical protein